jgi:hypothetical protein
MAVEKGNPRGATSSSRSKIKPPGGSCASGIALYLSQGGARLKVESPVPAA